MKGLFWNLGVRGKQVPVSKLLASGGSYPWPQPELACDKDSTRAVDEGALQGTLEVHGGALEAEEGGAWLAPGASPQIAS